MGDACGRRGSSISVAMMPTMVLLGMLGEIVSLREVEELVETKETSCVAREGGNARPGGLRS